MKLLTPLFSCAFLLFICESLSSQSCDLATGKSNLNINQVNTQLNSGGELWWDFSDSKYIVPKPKPGEKPVSAIFAGGIWIGGIDDAGDLKVAAHSYRQTGQDFWPGPIVNEEVLPDGCITWDKQFIVYGTEIDDLIKDFADNNQIDYALTPNLLGWPGRGNPHFGNIFQTTLPDQELAPFHDQNQDGVYNPEDGDYPILGLTNCGFESTYADQMIWWVYNDLTNTHEVTGGNPLGIEIQMMAYAFSDINGLEYTTFYTYDIINKQGTNLNNVYFGQWVDPSLGCWKNDMVGCDINRSMGIVYNDTTDYECHTFGGGVVNGYGNKVPLLGFDFLKGPTDENDSILQMSSFIYYDNSGTPTSHPNAEPEYYSYLQGRWRDGTPVEYGGNGYQQGTYPYPFMFSDDPADPIGWSECSVGNPPNDRRFIMSVGPFNLDAGARNEVSVGVIFVPDVPHPCPSFDLIRQSDDLIQTIFDNCFNPKFSHIEQPVSPNAPDITLVELDEEIVLNLSNASTSNNYQENFISKTGFIPPNVEDSAYHFQGYIIYQLAKADIGVSEFNDPDKARIVAITDKKDGIKKLYNFELSSTEEVYVPQLMVESDDAGLHHSFNIKTDLFADGNNKLINHKKYYFSIVAYAYNNYKQFNPQEAYRNGQTTQYIQSIDPGIYTAIPHQYEPELGVVNTNYGFEPEITRVDGVGNNGQHLQLTDRSRQEILATNYLDRLTYVSGSGPFTVKVINPLRIKNSNYRLNFFDDDITDNVLSEPINWVLTDLQDPSQQWFSDRPITLENEVNIDELGISLTIAQLQETGFEPQNGNGFVSATVTYKDNALPWYEPIADGLLGAYGDYIRTGNLEEDYERDPMQEYSNILSGTWYPYCLARFESNVVVSEVPYLSPAWTNPLQTQVALVNKIDQLNNVDIVITPNQDLWSRCPVINTFPRFYEIAGAINTGSAAVSSIRTSPSIGKDGQPDGDGTGMSWFPGYAIDVETGKRLNIFFGENSFHNIDEAGQLGIGGTTGKDMIWNPESILASEGQILSLPQLPAGGQHFVYVTDELYDECDAIRQDLNGSNFSQIAAWKKVKWTSFPRLAPGASFKSMADGLVPSEVKFELRVDNPYQLFEATGANNSYPAYEFNFTGALTTLETPAELSPILEMIQIVPNPYYGHSSYEHNPKNGLVKITNLPAQCTVTIYSLDGQLIRHFYRDEPLASTFNMYRADQLTTSLDWDLKSDNGVRISSGVYLIHISADGIGERVLKWFGMIRENKF